MLGVEPVEARAHAVVAVGARRRGATARGHRGRCARGGVGGLVVVALVGARGGGQHRDVRCVDVVDGSAAVAVLAGVGVVEGDVVVVGRGVARTGEAARAGVRRLVVGRCDAVAAGTGAGAAGDRGVVVDAGGTVERVRAAVVAVDLVGVACAAGAARLGRGTGVGGLVAAGDAAAGVGREAARDRRGVHDAQIGRVVGVAAEARVGAGRRAGVAGAVGVVARGVALGAGLGGPTGGDDRRAVDRRGGVVAVGALVGPAQVRCRAGLVVRRSSGRPRGSRRTCCRCSRYPRRPPSSSLSRCGWCRYR